MPPQFRYAIYFAPSGSLWRRGAEWLGRDAESGKIYDEPPEGLAAKFWATSTAAPRGYGFHGTLKPPFRLVPSTPPPDLFERVRAFARTQAPFTLPTLGIETIGSFLALTPIQPCPQIRALADACVTALDAFRAPPSDAELARRRRASLTPRQEGHLVAWGYPHVLADYRFHITLTNAVSEADERQTLHDAARRHFPQASLEDQRVEGVAVFHQPGPDQAFSLVARFPFGPQE